MKYFSHCNTLDELKKEYRKLSLKHHPDLGGDAEVMKAINAEHDSIFEILKAQQNAKAATDETHKTRHVDETAEEFRTILEILMKLDGLEIELCGSWLWIGGNTKAHKDVLKVSKCKWHKVKKLWYWHPTQSQSYTRGKSYDMDHIRSKYGSVGFAAGGDNLAHA